MDFNGRTRAVSDPRPEPSQEDAGQRQGPDGAERLLGSTAWVESGGPGYDRTPFVLNPGNDVRLYEYLIVRDSRREYYGRVVAGEERNEDATPERIRRDEAMWNSTTTRTDEDIYLTQVHHLEILGSIRRTDGRITVHEPDFLPETKARVYRPSDTDLAALTGIPPQGYELGDALVGNQVPFRLDYRAPSRHIGNFGRPGTGKTNLGQAMLEEFHQRGVPAFIFDANGELANAVEALGGRNLRPHTDIRVPVRHLDVQELLAVAPHMTSEQQGVLVDAFLDLSGSDEDNPTVIQDAQGNEVSRAHAGSFEIDDLAAYCEQVGRTTGQPTPGNNAARKIRHLRRDPLVGNGGNNMMVRAPGQWRNLFQTTPIINIVLRGMKGRRREIAVAAICRVLQNLRDQDLVPPFVLYLDEAHFFVPAGGHSTSTDVVRDFIRNGRHGPIGVVLASQSPAGIDRQILLLLNTVFAFALTGDDVRAVGDFLGDAPRELIQRIPVMPTGTAVVGGARDNLRHTLLLRIRRARTPEAAPTVDLATAAEEWRTQHRQGQAEPLGGGQ